MRDVRRYLQGSRIPSTWLRAASPFLFKGMSSHAAPISCRAETSLNLVVRRSRSVIGPAYSLHSAGILMSGRKHMSENELLRLSAQIVSAHAAKNPVSTAELTGVIQSVYLALKNVGEPVIEELADQAPAVPIKKSVFPSYIVCLEDGKKLKMLKRHLMASYGMTPDQYRAKWKLPSSYPMTAPDYAEMRSGLAKTIGLGRKGQSSFLPEELVSDEPVVQKIAEGKRGRKPAAKKAIDQPDMLTLEE
jgi:predicted transcriptional regulator